MSLGPLRQMRDDEAATVARTASPRQDVSKSSLDGAHLRAAPDTPPAPSDTELASRFGAPWACFITARELQRARKKDANE